MIVSRTPLRISLAGGGSDIPSFYEKHGGSVLNFTIDKYVYVACHSHYPKGIRLSYSKTEEVAKLSEIEHPLIRESLSFLGFQGDIEIGSFADVPATGTGLGSSSSFTVGLVNAVSHYLGRKMSTFELADTACQIEIGRCREPIGKQDQFAAAFGGVNVFHFLQDGRVQVHNHSSRNLNSFLSSVLMLYDLKMGRSARDILKSQSDSMSKSESFLRVRNISEMVPSMLHAIESGDVHNLAYLINESWKHKRSIVKGVTNHEIEGIIEECKKMGALGGKIVGAGGGGFVLLVIDPERKNLFKERFTKLRYLDFRVSDSGSEIVYNDEANRFLFSK